VFSFAGWAVLTHLTILTSGNLFRLLTLAAALLVAILSVVGWRLAMRKPPPAPAPESLQAAPPAADNLTDNPERQVVVLLGALLAVTAYVVGQNLTAFWLVGIATLILSVGFSLFPAPERHSPVGRRSWRVMLAVLCGLCTTLTLAVHKPNIDDSAYVNVAVTAADNPHVPLLKRDGLHGLAEFPPSLQYWKVTTIEFFEGSLAYLTGLPALTFAHLVIPAVIALLVPLAYARLFRLLLPRSSICGKGSLRPSPTLTADCSQLRARRFSFSHHPTAIPRATTTRSRCQRARNATGGGSDCRPRVGP
jgi:hypothetical protein